MSDPRPIRAAARRSDASAGRTEKAVRGIRAGEPVYMNTQPYPGKGDDGDFRNGGDDNSRRASDDAAVSKGPVLRGLPLVLLCCGFAAIRRLRDARMTVVRMGRCGLDRMVIGT